MTKRWGAAPEEWALFRLAFGFTSDMLPVISNPNAKISPNSSMQSLGKTPSFYNHRREVIGISSWTIMEPTDDQADVWEAEPDTGFCLIGRKAKAIDVDVGDPVKAAAIRERVEDFLVTRGNMSVPVRVRANSSKVLIPILVPEHVKKSVIRLGDDGIIELLGGKQQFIAAGTHPSGVRYEWEDLTPSGFAKLTIEELRELWALLKEEFQVDPGPGNGKESDIQNLVTPYDLKDSPLFRELESRGMVRGEGTAQGSINIVCPFDHEHTTEAGDYEKDSSTTYFPAHTGGHAHESIVCLHAHCQGRTQETFKRALGLDGSEEFEPLQQDDIIPDGIEDRNLEWKPQELVNFAKTFSDSEYLVKGLIPARGIGSLIGQHSAGKSFLTLDIAASIARGEPWRGKLVKQGRVVYVCAEGANGFKRRAQAYCLANGIKDPSELPITVLDASPNLMDPREVKKFVKVVEDYLGGGDSESEGEDVALVIFDTYAACMLGDENSSKDTGLVLRGCGYVRKALSCAVLLVHHVGKSIGAGARGHSSLPAAMDFELVVSRPDKSSPVRRVEIGKMKDGDDYLCEEFVLKDVLLGMDRDGEEVTSCVCEKPSLEDIAGFEEVEGARSDYESQLVKAASAYQSEFKNWPVGEVLIDYVSKQGYDTRDKFKIRRTLKSTIKKQLLFEDKEGRLWPKGEWDPDEHAEQENISE